MVVQFATKLLSPVTHSAEISEYTWTLCELPSLDLTETARYEKGRDWLTRSEGYVAEIEYGIIS